MKRDKKYKKEKKFQFRLSEKDYQMLKNRANKEEMGISEYIRFLVRERR